MAKVTFKEERCKGCKLCASVCPKKIVQIKSDRLNLNGFHPAGVIDIDKCIACGFCAIICPECIVKVEK